MSRLVSSSPLSIRASYRSLSAKSSCDACRRTLSSTSRVRPKIATRKHVPILYGQRRTFFGIGEIVGVLANPSEVIRNLAESRKLLEEAREDMKEMKERSQVPPKHTFSPLPGFFGRKREIKALERCLSGIPSFNVLFGASSCGKTALCREVLTQPQYHVLHFDLRIAGFADLASLYTSLATQMEQYFIEISKKLEGYQDFEKESYAFKHDRIAIEKRVEGGAEVKTSDIAHILELFQSALLKYWSFEPTKPEEDQKDSKSKEASTRMSSKDDKDSLKARAVQVEISQKNPKSAETEPTAENEEETKEEPPKKLIPVIFFDEAHRLPLLIKDRKAMKCILDAMLVLTKQDRLIHVVHATSDPFYMHWLRQLNVAQHCSLLSIGDCDKEEARRFFEAKLLPEVPEKLKPGLDFEEMFKIFGGKLAHLGDYVADYVNADGKLPLTQSSHYAQAHALLNLQLIHTATPGQSGSEDGEAEASAPGFGIYSPLRDSGAGGQTNSSTDFTTMDLLKVCQRLLRDHALPYFPLCRELGVRAVDGLVMGRILELRWTETITPEYKIEQSAAETGPVLLPTTPVIRAAMKQVVQEWSDHLEESPKEEAKKE